MPDLKITQLTAATDVSSSLFEIVQGGTNKQAANTLIYHPSGTDVALADGGTGASLTDPNADRIMFWDDSASAVTWLTPGNGLVISGTTITALDLNTLTEDTALLDNDLSYVQDSSASFANKNFKMTTLVAYLVTKVATAANFRANTDGLMGVGNVWSSAAAVTLTDAVTIAVDMSTFLNAVVTLAGNRTLGSPTNVKVGQTGCIRIVQDATGSRTLSYGADWEFAGGTAPVLTTTANATDLLFYQVLATGRIFANLVKGVV